MAWRAGTYVCRRSGDWHECAPRCLDTGDAHGAELAPSLPGPRLGWGQPVGSVRLGPALALASPAALGDPWNARLAPGCARRQSNTGQRNATSSPERDQTIRAKASNQILPPPWETTQQHSRYLPG